MKKEIILVLVPLISSICVFAQNVQLPQSAENIELPDITTEIEGEDFKAESDSLPDFEDLLKIPYGSGAIVPELPDILVEEKEIDTEIISEEKKEKNIFSEILLSGGYPLFFTGNCSIFGADQVNPFKILFKFNSASGYGGHSVNENFSDKNINLIFEKKYQKDNFHWGFNTTYNYISNGLQMKSNIMNVMNQEVVNGNGIFDYDFNNGFSVGANLNLDLYNRYGNIIGDLDFPKWLKRNVIFSIEPEFYGKWTGYGFDCKFSFGYLGAFNSSENISGGSNNRGNFKFNLQWTNDFITAFGDLAVVFGDKFNDSGEAGVLVPFSLGVNFNIPVYFSNRKVGVALEGGLDTYYNSINNLEYKYKFAALNEVPRETSFWYTKLNFAIPLKSTFSANGSIAYSKTAFNNGLWEPDYSDNSEENLFNGIYKIKEKEKQFLTTDFNITYHYKMFSIKGGLHSNWFDIPELEGLQMINLNVGIKDEKSKWGVNLFGEYNITKNWSLPVINLDCFVQISPTIRITASLGDIITLFNNGQRIYAGNYVDRGFTGALELSLVL